LEEREVGPGSILETSVVRAWPSDTFCGQLSAGIKVLPNRDKPLTTALRQPNMTLAMSETNESSIAVIRSSDGLTSPETLDFKLLLADG
jgi:hypothetical protein